MIFRKKHITLPKISLVTMETLLIKSKSKSNVRLLSTLARKLGDRVEVNPKYDDSILTHFASQNVLAKDWLTPEEDEAWKDL